MTKSLQSPHQSAPPSQQEELVRRYQIVEKVIWLKREINETLEKWMEGYYHILFDKLSEDQLERKKLGDLVTIVGGAIRPNVVVNIFARVAGLLESKFKI